MNGDQLTEDKHIASQRKKEHIELAFRSRMDLDRLDQRFYYEPMMGSHPTVTGLSVPFLGKQLRIPIWVSSMTGGTEHAASINHDLARVCRAFGMGMGLGSCRSLLRDDSSLADFDVRDLIGEDLPLYGNLGIAQVEELVEGNQISRIGEILDRLRLDGLIVHVNPLQEALQPEGDQIRTRPIDTIKRLIDRLDCKLIVKEVGQGFGIDSLRALFQLPLAAIDFGASGGTNFARMELLRSHDAGAAHLSPLANVGHTAEDMVTMVNELKGQLGDRMLCRQVIISGGIDTFLDGYYYINKLKLSCIYGQASAFLKYAMVSYDALYQYADAQAKGLALAQSYLRIRHE